MALVSPAGEAHGAVVAQLLACTRGECDHRDRPADCVRFDEQCSVSHRAALRTELVDDEADRDG